MTPAVVAARRAKIWHELREYRHDADAPSYGVEAAQALGLDPEHVFKTLVAECDGTLVVALVPVARSLDLKALAAAVGAKRAAMADPAQAERATGYVVGGISPLGQKKRLPMVADESMLALETVYVSAGRRGLELALRPADLLRLCDAATARIAR
ncbi:MAG TPA: Cys-tRNA(Pro) deacylase [Candidatus Binatia bacterium]